MHETQKTPFYIGFKLFTFSLKNLTLHCLTEILWVCFVYCSNMPE